MRFRLAVAWFSLWMLSSGAVAAADFNNQVTIVDAGGHFSAEKKTYQFTSVNSTFDPHFDGDSDLHIPIYLKSTGDGPASGWWDVDFLDMTEGGVKTGTRTGDGNSTLMWIIPSSLRSCTARDGQFTISTLVLTPGTKQISQFSATFDVRCPAQITGSVNYVRATSGSGGGTAGGSSGVGGIGGVPGGGNNGTPPPAPEPPPPPPAELYMSVPTELAIDPLVIGNSASQTVKVSTLGNSTFDSAVQVSASSDAAETDDFHVTVTPSTIPAPGTGHADVTITTGSMTMPRTYHVDVVATGAGLTVNSAFLVNVQCDPPFILGTDQPQNITAVRGGDFDLSVVASGTGPFTYQWYEGHTGMTRSPVEGATGPKMTTHTFGDSAYWVRIASACGTVDSNVANVTTTNALKFNKH